MVKGFENNITVATYGARWNVESAIRELQNSGFDLKRVSVAAKNRRNGDGAGACLRSNVQSGLERGFWKEMLGTLSGSTVYSLANDESVIVCGPLSRCVTAALDNPTIFGRLSTLCAALYILGIPTRNARGLEEDVQNNMFLVVAHGTTGEISLARKILGLVNGSMSPPGI